MTGKASIIFLHGASSSGKSTLARMLQDRIERPFWHISIDHLRDSGVLPLGRVKAGDFRWRDMRAPFFAGYHASLAAYAAAGNNLIVEHSIRQVGRKSWRNSSDHSTCCSWRCIVPWTNSIAGS